MTFKNIALVATVFNRFNNIIKIDTTYHWDHLTTKCDPCAKRQRIRNVSKCFRFVLQKCNIAQIEFHEKLGIVSCCWFGYE